MNAIKDDIININNEIREDLQKRLGIDIKSPKIVFYDRKSDPSLAYFHPGLKYDQNGRSVEVLINALYLSTSLLDRDEDEIRYVLEHENGHLATFHDAGYTANMILMMTRPKTLRKIIPTLHEVIPIKPNFIDRRFTYVYNETLADFTSLVLSTKNFDKKYEIVKRLKFLHPSVRHAKKLLDKGYGIDALLSPTSFITENPILESNPIYKYSASKFNRIGELLEEMDIVLKINT